MKQHVKHIVRSLLFFNMNCYILVCPGISIFFNCAILFIFPFEMDLINSSCRDLADTYWCCLFSSDLRKAHLFSCLILVQSAPRRPLKVLFTFSVVALVEFPQTFYFTTSTFNLPC